MIEGAGQPLFKHGRRIVQTPGLRVAGALSGPKLAANQPEGDAGRVYLPRVSSQPARWPGCDPPGGECRTRSGAAAGIGRYPPGCSVTPVQRIIPPAFSTGTRNRRRRAAISTRQSHHQCGIGIDHKVTTG